MKRRIRENIWGNWKGYEGTRKVADFGIDGQAAREWVEHREEPAQPLPKVIKLTHWKPGSKDLTYEGD